MNEHPNHEKGFDILDRVAEGMSAFGKDMIHHVSQEQPTEALNRSMDRLNDHVLEEPLESVISNHSLAGYAHEANNYDGANRALQQLTHSVRTAHQLAAQHLGDTHPLTRSIQAHLGHFLSLSNEYQNAMGARDYTTEKNFQNIMRQSGMQ